MKKENKLDILSVYDELCQRDPAWKHPKMLPKFKTLFLCWRVSELRRKVHTHIFYTLSWQRGWMPVADGMRFRKYALQ